MLFFAASVAGTARKNLRFAISSQSVTSCTLSSLYCLRQLGDEFCIFEQFPLVIDYSVVIRMSEKRQANRIAALQKRVEVAELFRDFVRDHPRLYEYTNMKSYEGVPYLEFEEKGFIKAAWSKTEGRPVIRLTLRTKTEDPDEPAFKTVAEDISKLSDEELANTLLAEINVDLNKPPHWEEGDDE